MTVSKTIETAKFKGTILTETQFAILWKFKDDDKEHWLPLSQISKIFRPANPQEDFEIYFAAWLAKKKGFID